MSKTYKGLTTNGVTELTLQEEGVGNIGTQTIVWDDTTNGEIDQVQGDIPANWKSGNGIKQLQIGTSCTTIGEYAFSDCNNLTGSLTIPDSVTSIGFYAFDEKPSKIHKHKHQTWFIDVDNTDEITPESLQMEQKARNSLRQFENLIDQVRHFEIVLDICTLILHRMIQYSILLIILIVFSYFFIIII